MNQLTVSVLKVIALRNWEKIERRKSNENESSAITQTILVLPHTRRQQRDHRKHVLQRINHRDKRHNAHRQRIVITTYEENLVLEENQSQHFETCLDT